MPKSYLNNASLPRGLRNNNPGNIRFSNANAWVGKVPYSQNKDYENVPSNIKRSFEQFTHVHFGIRAKMVLIYNKISSGTNTIEKLISVYAPAFENNTIAYINQVVAMTGIDKNAVIVLTEELLISLCKAISFVENGAAFSNHVTDADYREAIAIFDRPLVKKKSKNNTLLIAAILIAIAIIGYKISKKK